MDMISGMVNFIKTQEPFTKAILTEVSSQSERQNVNSLIFQYKILVALNGGNSIRFWLHPIGSGSTPQDSFQR